MALFQREDWELFTDLTTLAQKAGVGRDQLPRVVLKELVDNALDESGHCDFGLMGISPTFFYALSRARALPVNMLPTTSQRRCWVPQVALDRQHVGFRRGDLGMADKKLQSVRQPTTS